MKRILSGITPSGDGSLHIGNYLGAVKQFKELAKTHETFLMVADLHALTTIQDKKQLQTNIEALILNELALLGDAPIIFFRQSDVPLHTELQTILNNVTPLGLLKRAHAYKDKLQNDFDQEAINLGLFNYPVLMAADILIYQTDVVPVGKDQKQHIEITRDIGERFNKTYNKKVFKLPEAHIREDVAVVLGIDGKRKMSKSLGNIISIFDDKETIKKQVMGTYTDPTRKHATDPGHVEGNMVFSYLDHFGEEKKVVELKERYKNGQVGDVEVKEYLYESLMRYFKPARKKYEELRDNPEKVKNILQKGAQRAHKVTSETMKKVRDVIGLTNQYSFFSYQPLSGSDPSKDQTPSRPRHPERSHHSGRVEGSRPEAVFDSASLDSSSRSNIGDRNDDTEITIDDFAKVEQRVGKVVEATNVEKSEKLIKLVVDFGPAPDGAGSRIKRTVFTGVRPFGYTPEDFKGKQFLFVVNLKPRKMMNEESQGMILAVDTPDKPIFISGEGMPLGSVVR